MEAFEHSAAIAALLDEYKKALEELTELLKPLGNEQLMFIADSQTTDPACRSLQTILAHVVRSGYAYAGYIRKHRGAANVFRKEYLRDSVAEYTCDLDELLLYTTATLENVSDAALDETAADQKIVSSWGQTFSIEQMMEHAIVHILRHRRQVAGILLQRREKDLQ